MDEETLKAEGYYGAVPGSPDGSAANLLPMRVDSPRRGAVRPLHLLLLALVAGGGYGVREYLAYLFLMTFPQVAVDSVPISHFVPIIYGFKIQSSSPY